jgi:hypothetical protein
MITYYMYYYTVWSCTVFVCLRSFTLSLHVCTIYSILYTLYTLRLLRRLMEVSRSLVFLVVVLCICYMHDYVLLLYYMYTVWSCAVFVCLRSLTLSLHVYATYYTAI